MLMLLCMGFEGRTIWQDGSVGTRLMVSDMIVMNTYYYGSILKYHVLKRF